MLKLTSNDKRTADVPQRLNCGFNPGLKRDKFVARLNKTLQTFSRLLHDLTQVSDLLLVAADDQLVERSQCVAQRVNPHFSYVRVWFLLQRFTEVFYGEIEEGVRVGAQCVLKRSQAF